MRHVSRRQFIQQSSSALALGLAAPTLAYAAPVAEAPPASSPAAAVAKAAGERTLGKTGIKTSLLGMGTGTTAWEHDSAQIRKGREFFIGTIRHAYDKGLRYFDLADMYGSHMYMRYAMQEGGMDRSRLMLLTKTVGKTADAVRADLDRFRQEVKTDYFDVVLLHCMTTPNWQEEMKPCMEVLSEAKANGVIKAHGVSCHNLGAMEAAAESEWVDVMLNRINPYGVKMDGDENDAAKRVEQVTAVLKKAHANGKGMLGMKIAGEGEIKDRLNESIKFVTGLGCIDAMTIGFLEPKEIDDTMGRFDLVVA